MNKKNNDRILVYYGTYIEREILNTKKVFLTYESNELASFKKYLDIETKEEYTILYEECEKFEEENIIIKSNISSNEIEDFISSFNEIRNEFLNGINKSTKKEMIKKLLNEG